MGSVLKTVKWFLLKNAHAKTESYSKYVENVRTVLTHVLLVGLERNITIPQENITFNSKTY